MSPLENASGSVLLTPKFGPLASRSAKRITPIRRSPQSSALAGSVFNKSTDEKKMTSKQAERVYSDRYIQRRLVGEEAEIKRMLRDVGPPDEFSVELAACLTGLSVKDLNSPRYSSFKASPESPLVAERQIRENWMMSKVADRCPVITEIQKLDLPGVENDFYLNILDVSQNSILAIPLEDMVYLQDMGTQEMRSIVRDRVSSLRWLGNGKDLAIGTKGGNLEIWDTTNLEAGKISGCRLSHTRIGTIAQLKGKLIAAGTGDGTIALTKADSLDDVNIFIGHVGEVSSLAFSQNGRYLASGGKDKNVNIWRTDGSELLHSFTSHMSAIKALAWNPLPTKADLLASGGGIEDRTIKLWDVDQGQELYSVATEATVTNLHWLPDGKHLVSTHGVSGNPGLIYLWRLSQSNRIYGLKKILQISNPHRDRILYSSLSPDGKFLLTASAIDELLVKWDIKGSQSKKAKPTFPSMLEGVIR